MNNCTNPEPERIQYFDGIMFVRDETTGYFTSHAKAGNNSMHRYVWEFYNGPIPENCVIHHKDGNRANNQIDNLECMTNEQHREHHSKNLTEEQREWRRNNFNTKARPKAIEWHKSEAGRQWHKELAERLKAEGRLAVSEKAEFTCEVCGRAYERQYKKSRNRQHYFCSAACAQKWRRQSGIDKVEKTCPICGKVFKGGKNQLTCGHSCADKLRWQEGGVFEHRKRKGNA